MPDRGHVAWVRVLTRYRAGPWDAVCAYPREEACWSYLSLYWGGFDGISMCVLPSGVRPVGARREERGCEGR
jgi:hypothetical protein